MKKKKIIFISLASFLLVAAIVVTVLVLLNKKDEPEILPPPTELEVVKLSRPQGVKREGSVISWDTELKDITIRSFFERLMNTAIKLRIFPTASTT